LVLNNGLFNQFKVIRMKNTKQLLGLSLVLLTILFATSCATTKKAEKADTAIPKYELEAMQTGTQGTYLVKVWTYSKEPMLDLNLVKKNAIHGILFEGFKGKPGIPGQVAIAQDTKIEVEKAEFFKTFFSPDGDFQKFVTPVNNGAIAAEDRIRVGKIFKIGIVCSVKAADLRKHLEEAEIIKGLDAGFR
jgi:hypothetical protein